jgi:hypothetical protein
MGSNPASAFSFLNFIFQNRFAREPCRARLGRGFMLKIQSLFPLLAASSAAVVKIATPSPADLRHFFFPYRSEGAEQVLHGAEEKETKDER